jgi:hypothetical protein
MPVRNSGDDTRARFLVSTKSFGGQPVPEIVDENERRDYD